MKAVIASVLMISISSTADTNCLRYDQSVSLQGVVVFRTFTDANGRPERSPLLLLDEPICVDEGDDPANTSEGDQILIHLLLAPELLKEEGALANRRFTAKGRLFHAVTAHHHARLVLAVDELESRSPSTPLHPTRERASARTPRH